MTTQLHLIIIIIIIIIKLLSLPKSLEMGLTPKAKAFSVNVFRRVRILAQHFATHYSRNILNTHYACNIYTNHTDTLLSCNSRLYETSKPEL